MLQELRKDAKVVSFLSAQSSTLPDSFANLPLESLLILPVQRLPRYELLLRDIIKSTPEYHKDFNSLLQASKSVNEMTTVINESKRAMERMEQSLQIQQQFINLTEDLLLPHRKYLKHGVIMQVERGKNIGQRVLFVFSDILIIAEKKVKGTFSNSFFYEQTASLPLQQSDIITIGKLIIIFFLSFLNLIFKL